VLGRQLWHCIEVGSLVVGAGQEAIDFRLNHSRLLHRHGACDDDAIAVVYHPLDVIDEELRLRAEVRARLQACVRRRAELPNTRLYKILMLRGSLHLERKLNRPQGRQSRAAGGAFSSSPSKVQIDSITAETLNLCFMQLTRQ
jgi:hypothetical protein